MWAALLIAASCVALVPGTHAAEAHGLRGGSVHQLGVDHFAGCGISARHRQHFEWAFEERERLQKLGSWDPASWNQEDKDAGSTAVQGSGVHARLPLEADEVEALLIAVDPLDLRKKAYEATHMWQAVIASAQRQGIRVVAYTAKTRLSPDAIDDIRRLLGEAPDVDPWAITFIDDYEVDSVWVRDYGPVFYFESGSGLPAALDFDYFSDRPADAGMASDFAERAGVPLAQLPLKMEGGNLAPNGAGVCIVSDRVLLVTYRGTGLSMKERRALLAATLRPYGCRHVLVVQSLTYDITGHVDMWLAWANASSLLVGVYSAAQNPRDHELMADNLEVLTQAGSALGFSVRAVPMPSHCRAQHTDDGGFAAPDVCPGEKAPTTRTYLNALPLNNEVVVPVYAQHSGHEDEAVAAWEEAAGGRYKGRVVTVVADGMIRWHGSIHCMTRTIPKGVLPPGFWARLQQHTR